MASLAAPASATLFFYVDITVDGHSQSYFCAATSACNTSNSPSELTLATKTINGVAIKGEDDSSSGTPANPGPDFLSSSVGRVLNTSNKYSATVDVIVGDTSFTSPVELANLAGAGTFQSSKGSSFTLNWFADPANVQGALAGATPGVKIGTYAAPAVSSVVEGVSYTSPSLTVLYTAPFSVTEQTIYTLAPDGELLNRGQTAIFAGIPELSTWAMLLLGFAGLGLVGRGNERRGAAPFV